MLLTTATCIAKILQQGDDMKKIAFAISSVAVICLLCGVTVGVYWQKQQVLPVVFVKSDYAGFIPTSGSAVSNMNNVWQKSSVRPVCLVKMENGAFVPVGSSQCGVSWTKDQVTPWVSVTPNAFGTFEPAGN
jgi:hypothetical protein